VAVPVMAGGLGFAFGSSSSERKAAEAYEQGIAEGEAEAEARDDLADVHSDLDDCRDQLAAAEANAKKQTEPTSRPMRQGGVPRLLSVA
jgi:phage shock protein A